MSISELMSKALADGFDVEIKIRKRDDGLTGAVTMPTEWARARLDANLIGWSFPIQLEDGTWIHPTVTNQ